ncbi:MAG: glycosyltransferase family 2 protein [Candidatus Omnitrophica bacterium]|nr:glycosyltransferase family 2 protein [Candidatus Omnitrophota bacterium]
MSENNTQISVVILTFNEEKNLSYSLESVRGWSGDIHIVDSGSTDDTLQIAGTSGVGIHFHPWKDWADQRNWALENCGLKYEWVLFLDADEQLTPKSAEEILRKTKNAPGGYSGFYLNFDFYFLGKLVRNAMYPHLRLVRRGKVRWQVAGPREYCLLEGKKDAIRSKLIHYDHRGIGHWIEKERRNAQLEAEMLYEKKKRLLKKKGSNVEWPCAGEGKFRHRLRNMLDHMLPPFVRPLLFFLYRLFFKTDLRDGSTGFIYTFFFGLWYPMLVDSIFVEILAKDVDNKATRRIAENEGTSNKADHIKI